MDCLVDTNWLAERLGEPGLVVLDCTVQFESTTDGGTRVVSGRSEYTAGHIPGAGFADPVSYTHLTLPTSDLV